jgi:glycine cleavage system H protein
MNLPANLKYAKTDEWYDPASGKVGISDHAQEQLSDIVYVEILVEVGQEVSVGDEIASIESVKAAAEAYAPVSGKVVAINESLADTPEVLNSDPYGAGWLVQIEVSEEGDLMDAAAYEQHIANSEH